MLPQSQFDPSGFASAQAPIAIAAITQDRALIGLLRGENFGKLLVRIAAGAH